MAKTRKVILSNGDDFQFCKLENTHSTTSDNTTKIAYEKLNNFIKEGYSYKDKSVDYKEFNIPKDFDFRKKDNIVVKVKDVYFSRPDLRYLSNITFKDVLEILPRIDANLARISSVDEFRKFLLKEMKYDNVCVYQLDGENTYTVSEGGNHRVILAKFFDIDEILVECSYYTDNPSIYNIN